MSRRKEIHVGNADKPAVSAQPLICVRCAHCILMQLPNKPTQYGCTRFKSLDLVSGKISYRDCRTIRHEEGPCGAGGKLWEPMSGVRE